MRTVINFLLILGISCVFQGVDVSKWDEDNDWATASKSVYFTIMRAGYGFGHIDTYYEANYKNAKANGVKVGAYWYSYASSVSDAIQEANYFVQALKGKQFEWPVYYDIEEKSIFEAGIASDIAKAFCNILEANKYFCGIYSSTSFFDEYFDDEVKTRYTIWLAHWNVEVPTYKGKYDVWQYGFANIPGIGDNVDVDKGYKDFEPIMKERGLNGY